MNDEREDTPDFSCNVRNNACEVHRTSERRGVNLGMTPGVSWILFHYKWNLVVGRKLLPTAGYLHRDYDFGVVPKAPCNGKGGVQQIQFGAAYHIPCNVNVDILTP